MKIIDLTLEISDGMKIFPTTGYIEPKIKLNVTPENDPLRGQYETSPGMKASYLCCMVHTGTHIDAPDHLSYGKKLHEIPIETFIGNTVIIDMSKKAAKEAITTTDLEEAWKKIKKEIQGIAIDKAIIRTCWTSKTWGTTECFTDSPYLTKDAAQWLVKKGFKLIGLDFQTDPPGTIGRPVHEALLGNGVCIIEYLTNTEKISKKLVKLYALPMKLFNTEAAPARVIVIED